MPVEGPEWSTPGLDIRAGRYPLSVERHVMRVADLLVPGVTTVTPHARYYALHALVATEAVTRGLGESETQDLLRRTEVALAAVSYAHAHITTGLPRAHGTDALARRLYSGEIDMARASMAGPDGYVRSAWGFWNPYAASEVTLRILARNAMPTPGDACDAGAVRSGLGGLLDLAREERLVVGELQGYGDLCVCSGGRAADGRWLARLLCQEDDGGTKDRPGSRQDTIRLLTRLIHTHEIREAADDAIPVLAFGDFLVNDPVTSELAAAPVWRGIVLRNYAVGAWRRLWSWMVEQIVEPVLATEFLDQFCQGFPGGTVGAFLDQLPETAMASGAPAPAEHDLRRSDRPLPERELAVLAVGARRVDELSGRVRDAFLGQRGVELGPEWMSRRLDEARAVPLKDFARCLAADLLVRGRRVALSKARRNPDGTLWLPTRVQERGDVLYRTGPEGSGDVGLRIDQLTTVLAGAGIVHQVDGTWRITQAGEGLLG